MPLIKSYAHGQFSWVDLMAHDAEAAKAFYGELLGWESELQDTEGGPPYLIFRRKRQNMAGLGQMSDEMKAAGMPPVWNSYVNVDDVAVATHQAADFGANVMMPPMRVMESGHMSVIQDLAGATLSLWQKINHCGATAVNDPGCWSWNELLASDISAATGFYKQLFNWTFEEDETPNGPYWTIKNDDRLNGGMMQLTPEMGEIPPQWAVYFSVADIDESVATVESLGGKVLRPPFEVAVGRIAVIADSQGATSNLIQMAVPVD